MNIQLLPNFAGVPDPLCAALETCTHAPWRRSCEMLCVETIAPYRTAVLRGQALQQWRAWNGISQQPCHLQVELFSPFVRGE